MTRSGLCTDTGARDPPAFAVESNDVWSARDARWAYTGRARFHARRIRESNG